MTRNEAIAKVDAAIWSAKDECPNDDWRQWRVGFVNQCEALGLIKFDEPEVEPDIVELLRGPDMPLVTRTAADEIERLRNVSCQLQNKIDGLQNGSAMPENWAAVWSENENMHDEIERLGAIACDWADKYHKVKVAKNTETKELKDKIDRLVGIIGNPEIA